MPVLHELPKLRSLFSGRKLRSLRRFHGTHASAFAAGTVEVQAVGAAIVL